jgi:hypothetical protein
MCPKSSGLIWMKNPSPGNIFSLHYIFWESYKSPNSQVTNKWKEEPPISQSKKEKKVNISIYLDKKCIVFDLD